MLFQLSGFSKLELGVGIFNLLIFSHFSEWRTKEKKVEYVEYTTATKC